MAKYTSGRQKNLKIGIASYSENLTSLEVIGNVGIATTNATSKLWVAGDGYFTGVVTSSNFYVGGNLVSGGSSFSQLYVSGVSTFAGITTHTAPLFGTQAAFTGVVTAATFNGQINAGVGTITTLSGTTATYDTGNFTTGNIVTGVVTTLTSTNATLTNINSAGISTLGVTSATNLTTQNINNSGITTTNSLSIGTTQVISSARQLQNIASLDATTTATIEAAIQNAPNTFTDLQVTGISTLGVTSTTNLTAQQLNVSGVSTFSGITTHTTSLFGTQASFTGVVTALSFSGNASSASYATSAGIATYATNAGTSTSVIGGISSVTQLNVSGISTLGVTSTTNLTSQQLNVSGLSTFSGITTHTTSLFGTQASFTGIVTGSSFRPSSGYYQSPNGTNAFYVYDGTGNVAFQGTIGASQVNNASGLKVIGFAGTNITFENDARIGNNAYIAGVTTSIGGFVGNLTGTATTATTATKLETARNFSITGNFVTASNVLFDGTGNVALAATITPDSIELGTYTSGDYIKNISGTSNQITVTGGTGEGSTPTLSLPNNLVIPQDATVTRDLQVNRNLNVNGNITLGGTTAFINVQELKVADPDIVLGVRTDAFNNDVSNDTTANHGGIAIASTEGNPLITIYNPGIGESTLPTYKKIMWFKAGTFAGLGTDAWLINYAVGIGSTQFPTGTRLAAGNVQFTQNDLAVVRNINASGVGTIPTLSGTTATYTTGNFTTGNIVTGVVTTLSGTTATYGTGNFTTGNIVTGVVTTLISTNATLTNINSSGISTLGVTSATNLTAQQLNVSGVSTFSGITTYTTSLFGTQASFTGIITASSFSGNASSATYATSAGIATYASTAGIATYASTAGIATYATSADIATYATSAGIATYAIAAGVSTNLKGGLVGNIPYQSAPDTTVFLANGTVGQVLQSNGVGNPPSWANSASNGITVRDEGNLVGSANSIITLNFVGNIVSVASTAGIATVTFLDYVSNSGIATYATSAGIATYATNAGTSTSVIGGIGSITQLQVSGISTFTNGPVFIGAATSTGTASQPLQVTGNAYVSTALGIGRTNPGVYSLDVNGVARIGGAAYGKVSFGTGQAVGEFGLSILPYSDRTELQAEQQGTAYRPLSLNPLGGGVGIGTTNPLVPLSVVGNANFTGVVTASSFSGNASSATYATNAGIATYATSAGIATYASTAGVSTSVIGGISSVIQLSVSGVSTLNTVQISSGIITATSGIVTYYGDGSKLTGISAGLAINKNSVSIGTGITSINFTGSGISSVTAAAGISTVTIPGTSKNLSYAIATAGQTSFSATYTVGFVDVFMNGVKLSDSSYTATTGTAIVLNEGASLGDVIEIVGYVITTPTYNITISTSSPSGGANGDIWIQYTA